MGFDLKSLSLTRPAGWHCQCSRRSAHHLATPREVPRRKLDSYFTHFHTLIGVLLPGYSGQGRTVSKVAGEWTPVVTDHQEVTADLPCLASTPLRSFPRSPLISCGRNAGLSSFLASTVERRRATTLAPSTDRAPGRPALRHGRSPQSAGAASRWREIRRAGVTSRATFGASARRSLCGGQRAATFGVSLRPVYRSRRRRADPSSAALRAMPV